MEIALILATAAARIAAAWLAYRLFRSYREWRYATVTFVLAVTAVFPVLEVTGPPSGLMEAWLPKLGGALAVLLTALVLVRTLTELTQAYREVRKAHDVLEQRVAERTRELREANLSLESEVNERKRAEGAVRASETALRRNEAELRRLAGQLIAAQEDERRRLARELHDDLSQTLAGLALELANLRTKADSPGNSLAAGLESIESNVHGLADSIHDISRLLHPSILDDLGLQAAIRAECERFSEREEMRVEFAEEELPASLPDDLKLTLYRVAQEALHNISRHAAAAEARVELRRQGDEVFLSITDNGGGFEPEGVRGRAGLGLVSMNERVRLIDGRLEVESQPGAGAQIRVFAPWKETVDEQTPSLVG